MDIKLPGFFESDAKYKISDYFIRIEHQQRGAPHALKMDIRLLHTNRASTERPINSILHIFSVLHQILRTIINFISLHY